MEADLQILQDDRIKYHNNPLLGYLKINSLRNKVTDLRIIFKDLSLDYFVLSEAKLDESFPTVQFTSEGYETRSFGSIHSIPLFNVKHEYFRNSFLPPSVIEWNKLDDNIRNSESASAFKKQILKFIRPSRLIYQYL